MKITKRQLKQIIVEELQTALEGFAKPDPDYARDYADRQTSPAVKPNPKWVAQRKASQEYAQEKDDLNTRFMQRRKDLGYDDSESLRYPHGTKERRLRKKGSPEEIEQYVSEFPVDLQAMARRWLVDMDDEGY